jgi:hypothetical protein
VCVVLFPSLFVFFFPRLSVCVSLSLSLSLSLFFVLLSASLSVQCDREEKLRPNSFPQLVRWPFLYIYIDRFCWARSSLFCVASIAQLGERQTEDLKVTCSIHVGGTGEREILFGTFWDFLGQEERRTTQFVRADGIAV